MPNISQKASDMPSSPIRRLVPYADKAQAKGIKIYHLNIGQPDIKTPETAIAAMKNANIDVLEYSHSAGIASYRNKLAAYYQTIGIHITVEDLIVTVGGSEAITFGFMTACNPGDEVIIPEPFYANYNGFAVLAGVKIVPVTSHIEDGFALPPIEEIEKKITPKTKAIVICNPGNPTGYLYSKKELEQLAEIVKKHNIYLFSDEVYREFCYDGATPHSVMNLNGIEDNAIMIDSVSKRYSMCGARIGVIVSKNKEFMAGIMKFAQARLSPPTIEQIGAEAALDTPQSYFDEVIKEYVERRDVLYNGLNSIPGVFCPKPSGAFYCVAKLPVDDADKFCQWLLEEFEYEGQTVMMAPASGFYSTKGVGKDQVRLAYVLNKESLKNAITCLKVALEQYPGKISHSEKIKNLSSIG
ncbi:MAG: pyridoxal phosphate-dependent aminotransferase [Crocinitomicaceae bacterium]|nr:pyridoxal phosphate-dependent aminotransferase [Crocinitomicaceae bacterium]